MNCDIDPNFTLFSISGPQVVSFLSVVAAASAGVIAPGYAAAPIYPAPVAAAPLAYAAAPIAKVHAAPVAYAAPLAKAVVAQPEPYGETSHPTVPNFW